MISQSDGGLCNSLHYACIYIHVVSFSFAHQKIRSSPRHVKHLGHAAHIVGTARGTEEGGHPSEKQGASKRGFLEQLLRSKVDGTIFGTIHLNGIYNSGGAAEGGLTLLWRRPNAAP